MRCPVCNTENLEESARCTSCNGRLSRRNRRRTGSEEFEDAFSPHIDPPNRPAIRAFRLSVLGLIPGLGLVLGPSALVMGAVARWRARSEPRFTAHWPAWVAILLGALLTLTNWAGLVLMIEGLRR